MSGVAGIFNRDGRSIDYTDLERIVDILAHRGPDRRGIWSEGLVGLGHRMLCTTPESVSEEQPAFSDTSDLVVTADARIDNRDELIASLQLRRGNLADSEIILAAYQKWGETCPEYLLGDFAFAIWDSRRQVFFCARDHFGVKPFYYHVSSRLFTFASEIKSILTLPLISNQVNEERIADYLASVVNDNADTFYQAIKRLPPGHSMSVGRESSQLRRYWAIDSTQELRLGSTDEYAEAFKEIFTEAVRCRMRSAFPIGSLLSGGLDSSSVACTAQQLLSERSDRARRLSTFSAIYDELSECDERAYIDTVLKQYAIDAHYVHGDELGPFDDITRVALQQDEPFFAPNLFIRQALNKTASEQGVRVLLGGHDGDTTVSHGLGLLTELAYHGKWASLAHESRGLARAAHSPAWRIFLHFAFQGKLKPMLGDHHRFLSLTRHLKGAFSRQTSSYSNSQPQGWREVIRPSFLLRSGLEDRYETYRLTHRVQARTEREQHQRAIMSGVQPLALEVLDRAAAAFSIEPRFPLWDKRLVEFCVSLPAEQKLHNGWNRMVMRRAMNGVLPQEIQWRRDKTNFAPDLVDALANRQRAELDDVILHGLDAIEEYVDTNALRKVHKRLIDPEAATRIEDAFMLSKAISLVFWLRDVQRTNRMQGSVYQNRHIKITSDE